MLLCGVVVLGDDCVQRCRGCKSEEGNLYIICGRNSLEVQDSQIALLKIKSHQQLADLG
jgi:hypothetical protein